MREHLRELLDWARHIYAEFKQEHATLTAGALALFGLLSFFPLLLLAIALATYALGSPQQAIAQISGILRGALVDGAAGLLIRVMRRVVQTRGAAGIAGLLGFLWAASRVFTIMMEAFNIAWDVPSARSFLHRNLLAIGLVLVTLVFGIVSFAAPLGAGILLRYSDEFARWAGVPVRVSVLFPVAANLIGYAVTIGTFFFLYKVVPNRPVNSRAALVGALVGGTLWEIARYLFQLYLVNFGSYNKLYGALAGIIVLILWLYYSAIMLMLGAVTASVYSARVVHERAEHPQTRGFDERERRAA